MRNLQAPGSRKIVLGMVHLPPLPGTPFYEHGSFERTLDTAVASVLALRQGGADGCLIQTVDRVYSTQDDADPARTSAMALIVRTAAQAAGSGFEVGVQIMRNALKASLAVATIAGGTYVRVGALVGATMSAAGLIQPDAVGLMEYRTKLQAWNVSIIADIASMHFEWLGEPKPPVAAIAHAARLAGADAVSVGYPDESKTLELIATVRRRSPELPIFLAGYTNHENVRRLLAVADGVFVGTCLERGGWGGHIDAERVTHYVEIARELET